MSPTDDKQALRADLRGRRQALDPATRAERSRAACARLRALSEFERAGTVAGFVALADRGEIDPGGALDEVWRRGGSVVLPRVTATAPRLRFHSVERGAALRPGGFGLREPDAGWPEVAAGDVDVFVVPGLAFDAGGGRLGYGRGYYDEIARTVRRSGRPGRPLLVGFGYDFQVVDRVPVGPDDAPVDCVVTDARTMRCEVRA